MKNLFFLFFCFLMSNLLLSQTNTFPASGNVGIGTTSPNFPLHVRLPADGNAMTIGNPSGAKFFFKINEVGGGQIFARDGAGATKIFLSATSHSFMFSGLGIGVNPGISNPNNYLLAVNGLIGTKEVQVENTSSTWPDYVFDENYNLMPLETLESYIKTNKHLPNIPTADEVEAMNGFKLGEMNIKLLEKIEELTLYIIELEKDLKNIKKKLNKIENNSLK